MWLEMITDYLTHNPTMNVSHWVKPSGTTMSTLHLRWHYPSYTTAFPFFGCTADWTNLCLSHAMQKLGLRSGWEVFMSELIYGRYARRVKGDSTPYDTEDTATLEIFRRFAGKLLDVGRIVLLLGNENFKALMASTEFKSAKGLVIWPERKIFNQRFDAFVIYGKNQDIQQLVLLGWHAEGLLRTSNIEHAAHQDEVWNLAALLSGLQSAVKTTYFVDFIRTKGRVESTASISTEIEPAIDKLDIPVEQPNSTPRDRILNLMVFEKLSGTVVPFAALGNSVSVWLKTQPFQHEPASKLTLVHQIHLVLFANSGVMQQRPLGFPNLEKARRVQFANAKRDGYPNLQKAWAAMKLAGYPTLEKARAVLAALPGRRIVTKYIDAGDEMMWKCSTLSQATDPKNVDRECSICGEIVARDKTPRWFDLRKCPPGRNEGIYTLRRLYWPLYVPVGSDASAYLCSCAGTRKAVEYVPIDGTRCNPSAILKGGWQTFRHIPAPYGELLWAFRREILKGFVAGKVEFDGKVVVWKGARKETMEEDEQ